MKPMLVTRKRGFTIVELLIVIVVIGILVTLSVTTASGIQKRSRTAAIYANAKQLATAVVIYGQSAGSFPNFSMSCFGDAALFPATATNNAMCCWNIRQGATVWDQASVQSPTSMSSLLSTTISSGAMSYPVIQLSDTDGYQHAVRGYWYTRSGSAPPLFAIHDLFEVRTWGTHCVKTNSDKNKIRAPGGRVAANSKSGGPPVTFAIITV